MLRMNACPACGSSWIGAPIAEDQQHWYGGETHFSRCIGHLDWENDRIAAYQCPDCKMYFERPSMRPWPDFKDSDPNRIDPTILKLMGDYGKYAEGNDGEPDYLGQVVARAVELYLEGHKFSEFEYMTIR